MRRSAFTGILLLSCTCMLQAQNPVNEPGPETDLIEYLVEDQEESEFGFDTFLETLEYLQQNPLRINKTDYDTWRQTGLLTELQIRQLLRHIEQTGPLHNIYELQTIASFSTEDILRLQPYVIWDAYDGTTLPYLQQLVQGRYALFVRSTRVLQEQRGYQTEDSTLSSPYLGDPNRLYSRFSYNYKNALRYGFTVEKDPGEPFSGVPGFDYWSAHYFQKGNGWIKALAIGDYELRIGQGLIVWSGFGMGKSIYPVNIKRTRPVLAPYTSVDENRFFRGAAATVGKGPLELTVFGSYNQVDANLIASQDTSLSDPGDEGTVTISSLQLTGLHRTESEIADKDAVGFMATGGNLAWRKGPLSVSAAGILYHFDAELVEDRSPYELYDFEGSQLINASLSYNYVWRNWLLFGETAISDNGKAGTLNGLILPVDKHVDLALVYRYFDPGFQTFFSQSFSENTYPRNEEGWYTGIEITPVKAWRFNAYADIYKKPWLSFTADAPAYGADYLATVYYKPKRTLETYVRLRYEASDRNANAAIQGDLPHDIITTERKLRVRWNISYQLTREVTLRNRIEWSQYGQDGGTTENGYLLYQDVVYKPWELPFSLACRYTLFSTDTYNTRIYAYENDLLYAYSIANIYGEGQRVYAMVQYSPTGWLDTWIKYGHTVYTDRDTIGSGNEAIEGNRRSELRLQVRFKW